MFSKFKYLVYYYGIKTHYPLMCIEVSCSHHMFNFRKIEGYWNNIYPVGLGMCHCVFFTCLLNTLDSPLAPPSLTILPGPSSVYIFYLFSHNFHHGSAGLMCHQLLAKSLCSLLPRFLPSVLPFYGVCLNQ